MFDKKVRRGCRDTLPVDAGYLRQQRPDLCGVTDLAGFYLQNGHSECIDPTRYFSTEWYAWQNPDWSECYDAPYLHYLEKGCREGRDPSPFVDVARFAEVTGGVIPKAQIYRAILDGVRSPALGVYEDVSDLERAQSAFLDGIQFFAHRMTRFGTERSALVVCQAGGGAGYEKWCNADERDWDLLLNYYDANEMRAGVGDFVVFQKGTKFTAMKLLMERYRAFFSRYDHVLFIDDDVETNVSDLNRLFSICRNQKLDLAQMTLTRNSSCNWPHLYSQSANNHPRPVSAVEIMMPVFSRRALEWISPTLGQSISGFGLDLVWGQLVAENGGRIAVLDQVAATHSRAVDQENGAYYQYLRRHGINAKAELWTLLKRYGAPRDLVTT